MNEQFLEKYLNGNAPAGYEVLLGGQKIWVDFVEQYADRVEVDNYGNAYAYYGNEDNDFTVLLDAHADEIGYIVSDITPEGFIRVNRLGGSDIMITPSNKVKIWAKHGPVTGVFGHPAIHVQDYDYNLKLENLFIDVGAKDDKEIEEHGIEIGNPITMEGDYLKLGKFHTGRSLDDKIGGYINACILKILRDKNIQLPYNLVIVNSVQEEVGLKGASMAANKIKPDIAFIFDVTHCTKSPAYDKTKLGSIEAGKGVVLNDAPSIQKNLLKFVKEIAKESEISFQMGVSGRGTGTNTDSYAYPLGIPSMLFSVAMRYMHTVSEMVHEDDVNGTIKLILKSLVSDKIKNSLNYI